MKRGCYHNAWCCNFTINLLDWKEHGEKEQSWLWPYRTNKSSLGSPWFSPMIKAPEQWQLASGPFQTVCLLICGHQTISMLVLRPHLSLIVSGRGEWLWILCLAQMQIFRSPSESIKIADPLISAVELQEPVHRVSAEGLFGRLPHHKCNWLTVQWAASWSTSSLCAINPMCCVCEWSNAVALNVAFGGLSTTMWEWAEWKGCSLQQWKICVCVMRCSTQPPAQLPSNSSYGLSKWGFESNLLLACYSLKFCTVSFFHI